MSVMQIGGLSTGLDTNAIIDALVNVEKSKMTLVQNQEDSYNLKISTYGTLSSKLSDLQNYSEKLTTDSLMNKNPFDLFTSTSSSEDNVTVSGTSGAMAGEYSVVVSQRARAERLTSLAGTITGNDDKILGTSETAKIKINGVSINIDDTTTYKDLVLKINNANKTDGSKLGVQASLLKVSDNDYRLILSSTQEGLENGITLSDESGSVFQNLGIITDASGSKGNISQSYEFVGDPVLPQTGDMGATGTFTFTGKDHNNNEIEGSLNLTGKKTEDLLAYIESRFNQTVDATVDIDGHLIITDKTTGISSMNMSITGGGSMTFDAPVITTGQTGNSIISIAQDAYFSVNGVSVQSTTNKADEIISGVTFNINKADSEKEITVALNRDYDGVKGLVQGFLDSYNAVIDYIGENSKFSTASKPGETAKGTTGPLASDWTSTRIKSDLRSVITTQFSEWGSGMQANALSRIGIKSDATSGKLSIDDDKFKKAFDENFDDIIKLFTASSSSSNANISFGLSSTDTENGNYTVRRKSDDVYEISKDGIHWFDSQTRSPGENIISWNKGPAKGLALTIPVSNTEDAQLVFTKGIAKMMYETIDNIIQPISYKQGYLVSSQTSLSDSVKDTDDRITKMQTSLDDYRTRLIRQFSDLEKAVSQIKSQGSAFTQMISSYSSSS